MPQFIVIQFDRYEAVKSNTTTVQAQTILEACVKGFKEIIQDITQEELDYYMSTVGINEDGTKAGTDLDEESWLIFSL